MGYPVFFTSFIGRRSELREVETLLREKSTRLLTLTGPGGCGKTRLAYKLSTDLAGSYEDGIAWVDLVVLSNPEALPQTVAAALAISPSPGQAVTAALIATLQPRETLLVLDNCEHLTEACAALVDGLLRACPALYFLATSRQKLGVEGEQVWPVPPLSYPTEELTSPDSLAGYDALQLFNARAKQVRPKFEFDAHNSHALVKIAQLLEGMPLAIELAAARVNTLDATQMAARLETQLSFLTGKSPTADVRHQSMRAAIRWSNELLSEFEKTLFHRLGIFSGGFSLKAAEMVCSAGPLVGGQILDLLGKLIDKSLVFRERSRLGDSRYRLLESIRQYAGEILRKSSEEALLRDRHLAYFADLTSKAQTRLVGPEQRPWTEKLDADYENLKAALSWAIQHAQIEERYQQAAVSLATSLYWYWNYSERHDEARNWYEKILELPGLDRSSATYALLLHHLATSIWLLGDYPNARSRLEESLEIAQAVDYSFCIGHTKLMLGIMSLHQGRTEQVIGLLRDSEEIFTALDESRGLVITYANLGGAFLEAGDLNAANAYAEKAVQRARAKQDLWGLGLSLSGLGDTYYRLGKVTDGLRLMEEALELIEQSGQQWLRAEALWRLGEMLREQGDLERAKKRFELCYELAQEYGALEWQISALDSLGFLSLSHDRNRQAAGYFLEALSLTGGKSYESELLHAFLGVVQLAAAGQQWEQAATLWGAYEAIKADQNLSSLREENHTLELLRPHLEEPAITQAQLNGKSHSLAQASSLAMEIAQENERRATAVSYKYVLRLLALGPTEAHLRGLLLAPSDWTFAKPKELLYYLASNPPKTKDQIGLVFWPDASPGQLRTSLRAALYHLRRALGSREWIIYEDGYYRFNRSMNYWYDVEAFEEGLAFAQAQVKRALLQAIEKLEAIVELYRGDFLADLDQDEWATLRREELKRKNLAALNTLGDLLAESGEYEHAIEIFSRLLATDNLVEDAHRSLMRCYALQGERGLALRQYQTLVEILQGELGTVPSAETTELYRSIQSKAH